MKKDYRELYFSDYINLLSNAFDYALTDLKLSPDEFEDMLLTSEYLELLESLNPGIVSGESGVEFVYKLIDEKNYLIEKVEQGIREYRTSAFWVGYALANYQFIKRKRFKDIFYRIHLKDILKMYNPYHTMDIICFIDDFNKMWMETDSKSKLKYYREVNELSQSELAKLSGVSLRSIQLYEQKVNDIDKAQANTLYKLAVVLHCKIDDLLESPEL